MVAAAGWCWFKVGSGVPKGYLGAVKVQLFVVAPCAEVTALLDYMITKNFQSRGDTDLAFMVRMLADRYQMRSLLEEVDSQLETMLSKENVSWWHRA